MTVLKAFKVFRVSIRYELKITLKFFKNETA